MFARLLIVAGLCAGAVLSYLLISMSPSEAGAVGILAVFLLSYVVSVSVLTFFIFSCHRLLLKLLYSDRTGHVAKEVGFRKSYYYASILALGPVLLVSLRSVGQVGLAEFLLVLALLAIGCLYVSRQTS